MQREMLAYFLVFFVLTNALGLLVAHTFLAPELNEQIVQSVTLVNDDKQDPVNSLALLAYILLVTGILLLVIKFFQGKMGALLRIVEAVAIFFISISILEIILSNFIVINDWIGILIILVGIALVILRNKFPENVWLRNVVTILLAGYVGALIGTGLGVFPILIFLVLLSIYDFIAVFKTKHMVTLAKAVTKKNLAFSYALPTPQHQFELGTGDLVMPLAFATAVLGAYATQLLFPYYVLPALLILVGSLTGLLATLEYCSRNVGKALPALPLQTVFMLVLFVVLQAILPL